ncbi:MAG: S41 family peptidase [Candidatus Dadabacteria bacterium]|nr:S41 family peptidase [Candidatus Dadabacteria bacterium]MDE0519954.1 S41 family peptidase [Candidatus Dadabacteria bacterium]MDE0662914.1 S41 family peptidase [Candidatus Dadabacteria bacterium]
MAFNKNATVQGTRTDENNWLRSWSHEIYLWYDEIVDMNPTCCTTPEYFDLMKTSQTTSSGKPKDRFHFSQSTAEYNQFSQQGVEAGYGAVFRVLRATVPRKVIVLRTEPNSPATASSVNLLRGTEILGIDGIDLVNTTDAVEVAALNSALNPSSGDNHTFTVKDPGASSQERSVPMTAGTVTVSPVQEVKVITTSGGDRVGYMLFNSHISTAAQPLINAVNSFVQGTEIDDLVLDLRYNGGGAISIAQLITSMIAGSAGNGKTFAKIEYNDKKKDASYPFATSFNSATLPTLDLSRLFVLTSASTCSASELIINSLMGVDVDVIVIGTATCGKYHGFIPRDNCGTTYFSIEFRVVNDRGAADYDDGFSPDCSVADNDYEHQLGDPEESLLKTALAYQADDMCPSSDSAMIQGSSAKSSQEGRLSINPAPAPHSDLPGLVLD